MKEITVRLIKLILFTLMIAATSTTFAARVYQIDVIVFSHVTTKALLSENWPLNPTLPALTKAIELVSEENATPNALYQLLPKNQSKLAKEVGILNKQSGYHVLVDASWRQPAFAPRAAKWIHIEGGENTQVNGMLKISRPTLFQADANLVLTIPKTDKVSATQFVLQQTASLRANQIYYFDHPLFGAIVRITPLEQTVNESDVT